MTFLVFQSQTRSDGSVEVIGCTDHVGHTKSAEKLLLTSRQKEELRGLISGTLTFISRWPNRTMETCFSEREKAAEHCDPMLTIVVVT